MASNCMSSIAEKFSAIPYYLIGSNRISRSSSSPDYNSIASGVSLLYGVILDYNAMFCLADRGRVNHGRIVKHAINGWTLGGEGLFDLLASLDELNDLLLQQISAPTGFKVQSFRKGISTWNVPSWLQPLRGCILEICRSESFTEDDQGKVRLIRCMRQIASFLKKLDVARPDLEDQMQREFLDFEEFLASDVPIRELTPEYKQDVADMRAILVQHVDHFQIGPFVPVHGPGAVSDVNVKCWYDKHTNAHTDARVAYLLAHASLGTEQDYLPLVKSEPSNRTSRFVCVPKTWKKLRGISTEPPELQFWQQGVLRSIDAMFTTDSWWASRINLHDQTRSRKLALVGSLTGSLSTVDLSAASDSVTLQLVRDVFKNTHIGRWLLGTRSTSTICNGTVVKISKFAPMGSACCFPTECMIFCLAAEVAVRRTAPVREKLRTVCVYGDDIIVPSYATYELFEILRHLGFSVNTEKSFWEGDFREACGIEAWRGQDIAPCRFSAWGSGYLGHCSDYAEISALVAFANEFINRGLHDSREFLLNTLFNKRVRLGNSRSLRVQDTVFTSFSGEGSSLISPCPTNFNLKKRFDRHLQTTVYRRITWQERAKTRGIASEMSGAYDVCKYTAWLIGHQPDGFDYEGLWSKGWIECRDDNPYTRLPIGTTMVPTVKWVLPPSTSSL